MNRNFARPCTPAARLLAAVAAVARTAAAAAVTAVAAVAPASAVQADPAQAAAVARQEASGRAGIAGTVLDASSGAPLDGATVVLQPEVVGAFPAGPASGSAFTTSSRAVVSDRTGAYRFDGLGSGVYRIYVSRFGYRPYSVTVELRGSGVAPVAVALTAEPIPLAPVRSAGQPRGPFEESSALEPDAELARLRAADLRRHRFLTTDARELTYADVVEAVTLGEPDVMRALQRLPGVTTRSDYTAELWTRGAPWPHTRVYFDGMPLFNPLHALGVLSGIGSSAIGAVWFHPGARSAAIAEGAAGVVDLQSRRAAGDGQLNVHADLSLMSAGLALDQRVADGRFGWMLSGRQAWLDWFTALARRASGSDDVTFPYGFSEVTGRGDVRLSASTSLEISGLWERDHLTSSRPDASFRAEWGNAALRASLNTRIAGLHTRQTVFTSSHHGLVLPDSWARGEIPNARMVDRESDTGVRATGITGTVWPEPRTLAGPAWSAGYSAEFQEVGYFGPQVLPIPRFVVVQPGRDFSSADSLRLMWDTGLPLLALWGEGNWTAGERLGIRTGLRLETGSSVRNGGSVRVSPRASARLLLAPEVALSAGLARVYQYTQAVAPGGLYVASLATTDVWLLAGSNVPALRSDIATLGTELWVGSGRTAALNGFVRRSTGVATPDPTPGRLHDRPTFVVGEGRAAGAEFSVRQLTGPVTGGVSYTLSSAVTEAAGRSFTSSSDRRHVLSATGMLRATPSLRTGAALTAATGVPFTRVVATPEECGGIPGCDAGRLPWLGEPNAARAPSYASLDLLLDWSGRAARLEYGAYLQLRNALGRENATIYTGDDVGCMPAGCGGPMRSEFERGIPRIPVIGVRVRH
jgi:hypothetical protein